MIDNWLGSYTKLCSGYMIAKVAQGDSRAMQVGHSGDSTLNLNLLGALSDISRRMSDMA